MQLVKYETARQALAEVRTFDEAKVIRDKAEALAAYARMANDSAMIEWATEIKVRAERACGEMLRAAAEKGERAKQGGDRKSKSHDTTLIAPPTLETIGITKDQSSRYQKLADMPEDHFEVAVATAKAQTGQVTTAFMLRATRPQPKMTKTAQEARKRLSEIAEANDIARELLKVIDSVSEPVLQELVEAISAVRQSRARKAA